MKRITYDEAVAYIENIPMFGPKTDGRHKSGNANLSEVLERLDNPHLAIKSVHIAGTNGKGSTATMIANILAIKEFRVGVFTSPHLVTINERITIMQKTQNDEIVCDMISDDEFVDAFLEVQQEMLAHVEAGGIALSYFEFLFAMAACYYRSKDIDFVVYETGLGGRLDATNTVKPQISVITSIGLDHMQYLGDTIEKIAYEKAGIIKKDVPVVYLTGEKDADAVIHKQAEELGTKEINVVNSEYIINDLTDKTIDFSVYNRYYKYNHLELRTCALYQVDNARLAIEAGRLLLLEQGMPLSEQEVRMALDQFVWGGRMETIRPGVFFDGAHNPDAIDRFVETVQNRCKGDMIHLLFAVAGDKDYSTMIDQLCASLPFASIGVTAIANARKISAELIAKDFTDCLKRYNKQTTVYYSEDMEQAYKQSVERAMADGRELFCVGSLYLVGSLKQIDAEVFK